MLLRPFQRRFNTILYVVPILILLFASCEQYEYTSPLPGIVQLNLRAKYTQFDTAFSLNNFVLRVTEAQAVRSDGARANIFLDPKAIGRPPDVYNMLGKKAYDSTMIIGQYPLPPAQYNRLTLLVEPGPIVLLDGYRAIFVDRPTEYSAFIAMPTNFTIEESKTTIITITVDLDATLQKLAYTFLYQPRFYVSSITVN